MNHFFLLSNTFFHDQKKNRRGKYKNTRKKIILQFFGIKKYKKMLSRNLWLLLRCWCVFFALEGVDLELLNLMMHMSNVTWLSFVGKTERDKAPKYEENVF